MSSLSISECIASSVSVSLKDVKLIVIENTLVGVAKNHSFHNRKII